MEPEHPAPPDGPDQAEQPVQARQADHTEPTKPVSEADQTGHAEPADRADQARGRRAASVARAAYLVALAAAIVWLAASHRDDVADLLDEARPERVAAALVATFGLILLTARFWVLSLRMLGHDASLLTVATATARALPARYVPAGVTFPAARVALLRAQGLKLAPLTVSAALEMVVRPAVALALGMALLALSGSLDAGLAWAAAAVAVLAVAASPAIGGRVLARLAARRGVSLAVTWSGLARLAATEALYWAWAAATFVLYLRAFPAADGFGLLHAGGAFMVAWAVGFLAVFAPQGLGVAEVSLVGLLAAGDDGAGIALAVLFAGYRLVQLARDVLAASAAEIISKRRARRGSAPTG